MTTYMYTSLEPEDFRVIHQAGVQQACFPRDCPFAACWDGVMDPDGRVFVAAGSEASIGEYVKLCEYSFENNRFDERFYGRDVFLPPPRAITSSKFHFTLDVMEDGRLIGASHTTDRSPDHPAWMYKQYYYHLWEGFPGSSLIIYDPQTRTVEHLGIPVPRETLYGSVYNPKDRGYYCLGYIRGHLYRYSLETRRLTDFGKVSEWKTFRLHLGPDGNIYGASRSGFLFMLEVDTGRILDLETEISSHISDPKQRRISRSFAGSVNIPGTSEFLFTVFSANEIYRHDTATHTTEYLGRLFNADQYVKGLQSHETCYALQLDAKGVLWYALTCYPNTEMNGDLTFRRAASLLRWDILRGGDPECLGVLGTPKRINATVPTLLLDNERDRMYIVDTNHGEDGFSLLAIDMHAYRPHMYEPGPPTEDPFLVKDSPRYLQMSNAAMEKHQFTTANSPNFSPEGARAIKLWRECRPEDSKVIGLAWKDDQTLCGLCGDQGTPAYAFQVSSEGEIRAFDRTQDLEPSFQTWLDRHVQPGKTEFRCQEDLPHRSGRRYKAVASAMTPWNGGRHLVGTQDGMLAVTHGDNVFSLGAVAPHGPIQGLATNPEKNVCYGIAGDAEDLGLVFRYDDRNGLRELGCMICDSSGEQGQGASHELSSIVMNAAGTILAIGSNDRLGMVYLIPITSDAGSGNAPA